MSWSYSENLQTQDLLKSTKPVLIFKHSNRCVISSTAFNRVIQYEDQLNDKFDFYLIDVVKERALSLQLADELAVTHESPQVIVIHQGKVIYNASHLGIQPQTLLSLV